VHENYKKFQCQSCDFGFWKIMGGRQFEVAEAEALLRERVVGPLEGFRSKLGRPFTASIKLNDDLEVKFDFDDGPGTEDAEPVDFSAQEPLGDCPKCGARVFEHGQSYVCEKATGPARSCDFRSGRLILQRPVEPAQMRKLLATGKTDLLQFVSARTRRPFSAFLVRQPDGKIGFEFEAKAPGKGARGRPGGAPLRVLGAHPDDNAPVELHAGRYGPYVKHGAVNATLPDRDKADSLTLDEALAILAEKVERSGGAPAGRRAKPKSTAGAARPRARVATVVAEPAAPSAKVTKAAKTAPRKVAAKRPAARKTSKSAAAKPPKAATARAPAAKKKK
jgi:DNA topoisomerase-3